MAGTQSNIRIEIQSKELRSALARLADFDMEPVWRDVGEAMLNSIAERFRAETDPAGRKWDDVQPKTRARKKHPLILSESTDLRNSLSYRASSDELLVGTAPNIPYAAVHQFGWPERNIPARPFLGVSDSDEEGILDILRDHIELTWRGS